MNKIILGITLLFTASIAQANSYFEVGVATDADQICNNGEITLGTKLSNGYGPQVRLQGFNGDKCRSNSAKVAVDFRKDIAIGNTGIIANAFIGLESDKDFETVNFVGGAGVNKYISNRSMIGLKIKNSYDNIDHSEMYYGVGYTVLF
jgi:hypothetical protein